MDTPVGRRHRGDWPGAGEGAGASWIPASLLQERIRLGVNLPGDRC
ncbi:hypothetical protein E2C01_086338 [Portunus trituberculatus]|uniref:Uncharacterized protein n=1 Tax=Portunus trituberculatus TaxID=210409 RepID=A0A5B7J0I4_PORTR|nr:hypothetical protein [Portunus trituberculatus]